jgi:hypothetical protein
MEPTMEAGVEPAGEARAPFGPVVKIDGLLAAVGIVGLDEAVEGVVLVVGGVAAGVGIGGLVAVGVVLRAGDAAERRLGLGEVTEGVVGVGGGGLGGRGAGWDGLGHGDLLAEGVVSG